MAPSDSAHSFREDDSLVVLTGLSSRGGLSNWVCCFGRDDVVLLDQGAGASITAGVRAGIAGTTGIEIGSVAGGLILTTDLVRFCEDAQRKAKAVVVIPDAQIVGVRLHLTMFAHELILTGSAGDQTFSFLNRPDVDPATSLLAPRYASRFRVTTSAVFGFVRRRAPFLAK